LVSIGVVRVVGLLILLCFITANTADNAATAKREKHHDAYHDVGDSDYPESEQIAGLVTVVVQSRELTLVLPVVTVHKYITTNEPDEEKSS